MEKQQENGDQHDIATDKLDVFLSPWACDCGGLIKDAGGSCHICQANGLEKDDDASQFITLRNKGRRFSTGYESQLDQFLKFLATNTKYKEDRLQGRVVGMYKFHCEIGCGGFSKVKLATHIFTKEQVAIKVIDKSRFPGKLEKILGQEVRCMEVLNHPNLIRLYEVIESMNKVHLVTELAPAGDLYMRVKSNGKLEEPEAKFIFGQVVDAILYMHDNGIYHRDIKAENVLFSSATLCKVCDFGFSTVGRKDKNLLTFCGSPAYSAPELYQKIQYEGGPADAWSLGVVLYFVTEGRLPFRGNSMSTLKKEIMDGTFEFSENPSKQLAHLLKQIMKQKPAERFTVAQIKNHPWLTVPVEVAATISSQKLNPAFNNFAIYDVQESVLSSLGSRYDYNNEADKENARVKADLTLKGTKGVNCRLIPTKEQIMFRLVSKQEIKAYEILLEIGVSEAKIRSHKSRGMRSYLIGIYRIILHKVQRGEDIDVNKLGLPMGLSGSMMDLSTCGKQEERDNAKENEVFEEKYKNSGEGKSNRDSEKKLNIDSEKKSNSKNEKKSNIDNEKKSNIDNEKKSNIDSEKNSNSSNTEKSNSSITENSNMNGKENSTGSRESDKGQIELNKSESSELDNLPTSVSSQKKRILNKTGHVVSAKVCAIL